MVQIFIAIAVFVGLQLTSAQIPGTQFATPVDFFQCASDSLSNGKMFPDLKSTVVRNFLI